MITTTAKPTANNIKSLITSCKEGASDFSSTVYLVTDYSKPRVVKGERVLRQDVYLVDFRNNKNIDIVSCYRNEIGKLVVQYHEKLPCTVYQFSSYLKAVCYVKQNFRYLWDSKHDVF